MTTYALDADMARSTDQTKTRIDASGEYIGIFTKAKKVLSNGGTEGIDFSFESQDGATADYLTLWTIKSDGSKTYGYGLLMALMTCMKVRQIGTQKVKVEEWDDIVRARVEVEVDCFTELMSKPVGVILQREPMTAADGSIKTGKHGQPRWKLNIFGFFDAETRRTAGEILDKVTEPARLNKKLATLRDKPMPATADPAPDAHGVAKANAYLPPLDSDDIPF